MKLFCCFTPAESEDVSPEGPIEMGKRKPEALTEGEGEAVTVAEKKPAKKAKKTPKEKGDDSSYFSNPNGTSTSNPTRSNLSKTFDKYRDDPKNEPDLIDVEGTSKLLGELNIELDDVGALIFSETVQSPSLGKITREGFVDGWSELGIDSLPRMKNAVLQRRSAMPNDREMFKGVYNHTFTLALQPPSKTLPLELAIEFWRMLFTPPAYAWGTPSTPWLDWWLQFQEEKKTRAVNRDLWRQTLNFAEETMKDESLSFWNEESSWPSVVDEFVEWVKTEKRPGGGADDGAMEVE